MASPAYRSDTWAFNFGGAITNVTGTEPAGAATGDGLLVTCLSEINGAGPGTLSMVSPFVFLGTVSTTPYKLACWYARRGGSAPSYVVSFSNALNGFAQVTVSAVSGCVATGAVCSASLLGPTSTGTIVTPPTVYVPGKESLAIAVATNWTGWSADPTVPTGYTFRQGPSSISAAIDSIIASKTLSVPGKEAPNGFGAADASDAQVGFMAIFASQIAQADAVLFGGSPTA